MMKRSLFAIAMLAGSALAATPASAQMGGRLSVMPYAAYGFFGSLPGSGPRLEADVAYGGRGSFQLSDQFAVYGNFQRSTPAVDGFTTRSATVDHWSTGVEFSYVPRGGAEGMLPVLIEAGLGQARYRMDGAFSESSRSDLAANIGIGSALQLTPNFGIRYGANDYISNYRGDEGIVNQIFVHVGAELTF